MTKRELIPVLQHRILLLEKELSLAERINSCEIAFCIMAKNIEWLLEKVSELREEKKQVRAQRKAFEREHQAILTNGEN